MRIWKRIFFANACEKPGWLHNDEEIVSVTQIETLQSRKIFKKKQNRSLPRAQSGVCTKFDKGITQEDSDVVRLPVVPAISSTNQNVAGEQKQAETLRRIPSVSVKLVKSIAVETVAL